MWFNTTLFTRIEYTGNFYYCHMSHKFFFHLTCVHSFTLWFPAKASWGMRISAPNWHTLADFKEFLQTKTDGFNGIIVSWCTNWQFRKLNLWHTHMKNHYCIYLDGGRVKKATMDGHTPHHSTVMANTLINCCSILIHMTLKKFYKQHTRYGGVIVSCTTLCHIY